MWVGRRQCTDKFNYNYRIRLLKDVTQMSTSRSAVPPVFWDCVKKQRWLVSPPFCRIVILSFINLDDLSILEKCLLTEQLIMLLFHFQCLITRLVHCLLWNNADQLHCGFAQNIYTNFHKFIYSFLPVILELTNVKLLYLYIRHCCTVWKVRRNAMKVVFGFCPPTWFPRSVDMHQCQYQM